MLQRLERFISRATKTHGSRYSYAAVGELSSLRNKVEIVCRKHGSFTQRASAHIGGQGCPRCKRSKPCLTKEEVLERFRRAHGDRYSYRFGESTRSRSKVQVHCHRHDIWFRQSINAHAMGKGCCLCANEAQGENTRMSWETVKERFIAAHGDRYDYSETKYISCQQHLMVRCREHGLFEVTAERHYAGCGCPKCSCAKTSRAETELRRFIESLGVRTIANSRKLIHPYEVDILCPDECVAIEFNGNIWHSSYSGTARNYHADKAAKLSTVGYRAIFIRDDEWRSKRAIVKSIIRHAVGRTERRINARQCTIHQDTPAQEWREFADNNHIQGRCNASFTVGLRHEGELVCVMAFIKRKDGIEMVRFVTKLDTSIRGGFSRCARAINSPFYTYCENRLFGGSGYLAAGMVQAGKSSPPDLSYTNGHRVENRRKFQKKAMASRWEDFDPTLTEKQNAEKHGWYQLWGCGTTRYAYRG